MSASRSGPRRGDARRAKGTPKTPVDIASKLQQGLAFHRLGKLLEAESLYREVLLSAPANCDALQLLGSIETHKGNFSDAVKLIDRAIKSFPNSAGLYSNLGLALHASKRLDEALASYEKALSIDPHFLQALFNRANVLLELRCLDEALTGYNHVLSIQPDHFDAFFYRSNALKDLGRLSEALTGYDKALAIKPDFVVALYNRGSTLLLMREYEAAAKSFAECLRVSPDLDYILGSLFDAQLHSCDWSQYQQLSEGIHDAVARGERATLPFTFLAYSTSAAMQLQCSRTFAAERHPPDPKPLWRGERYRHGRIRLAYLCAEFHNHATAFLMAGVFERHDKARFETVALSYGPDDGSAMRARLKASFDRFIDGRGKTDFQVASLLRQMEVDILVDLKGHTEGARTGILARRAAPIQINYLAYPGTMGADYMDYILADRIVIPEDQRCHYTEKIGYLPDTYQANDPKRRIAEHRPSRADVGLPNAGFVFCSFNNNYKITPEIFDVWMRLLHGVDKSVLWLLEDNKAAARNLKREAEARGIAAERLVFAPRLSLDDHLARQSLADLFLDTLPCTAHTTASDALWAGLPLLTCTGNTFAGRVAASLLHAIGLPELVTHSLTEYEALARKFASDPGALLAIKEKLARNRQSYPLFDTERFTRDLERAYTMMWQRHQNGEAPASFEVKRPVS